MRILCLVALGLGLVARPAAAQDRGIPDGEIRQLIAGSGGTIAVVAWDLGSSDTLMLSPDLRFHAASTMKVPVLIELARRIDGGELSWTDSLPVKNQFVSIVDGSPFTLDPAVDSDSSVYGLVGSGATVRYLAERMIERSSNLATNILIERLDPVRVNRTAHALGADSIEVRRGVEDGKAYDHGLNNTTTARDLARLLEAIVRGRAASPAGTNEMLRILSAQEFNDGIPAGLPPGTRVAHKTGEITQIAHDAGVVFPSRGAPVILVVLTRGFEKREDAMHHVSGISRLVYEGVMKGR
ncbi:MAG TPA: serine hydrolase [Gemmatimonadales bacterium]|nr:serine hydrolase [Gemmatimonadales bacterium]